jgi:SagB-type dehydrogenase family enzyme
MKKINFHQPIIFMIGIFIVGNFFCQDNREKNTMQNSEADIIQLPAPIYQSNTSFEEALQKRRSVRDYIKESLSLFEISQILWAAQGITDNTYGLRTAPSAGALYPIELYLVAVNVTELTEGIYKYDPRKHTLKNTTEGDKRIEISNAALSQDAIEHSSAIVLITAIYERTSVKYGKRAERYVNIEVGHVGQNIYLQAVSLGLGTVMIGAFKDDALKKALNLSVNEFPLAIYPIGKI